MKLAQNGRFEIGSSSVCYPGKPLEGYADGKDPISNALVWGTRRLTRQMWKSAEVDYAIALAKGILPCQPHWLEEPLRPDGR